MTRIKTLAIGAITTAMIFGSTIVLANESTEQAGGETASPASATVLELANPAPVRRGGGGSGKALKK